MTRMHREHELSHTFLAEKRGFHHSPTLWSVAHKEPYLQAWEEEAIVLGWQWFLNTGELTGAAEILRAHRTFDVDEIAREFKQRFR